MLNVLLYKLYSQQLNCTYSNYTEAAATCSAAQEERNSPAVVVWSAVQPVDWYCIYTGRQSHPVIRSFKEIQMTKNALPQFHRTTQHTPNFLSGDCEAAFVANSSLRMGWRNSGTWRDRAWRWLQAASPPHQAPSSAIYPPVHIATEPCQLQ